MNKWHEIGLLIDRIHPDVMAFSETWLCPDISDTEIAVLGYNMFRTDRYGSSRFGGVIIYIKEGITALPVLSMDNVDNLEVK